MFSEPGGVVSQEEEGLLEPGLPVALSETGQGGRV